MNREFYKFKITQMVANQSKYIHWLMYNTNYRFGANGGKYWSKVMYANPDYRLLVRFDINHDASINVSNNVSNDVSFNVSFINEGDKDYEYYHINGGQGNYPTLDGTFKKDLYFEEIDIQNGKIYFQVKHICLTMDNKYDFKEEESIVGSMISYNIQTVKLSTGKDSFLKVLSNLRASNPDYYVLAKQKKVKKQLMSLIESYEANPSITMEKIEGLKAVLNSYDKALTTSEHSRMGGMILKLAKELRKLD